MSENGNNVELPAMSGYELQGRIVFIIIVAVNAWLFMFGTSPVAWLSVPAGIIMIVFEILVFGAEWFASNRERVVWVTIAGRVAIATFACGAIFAMLRLTAIPGLIQLFTDYYLELGSPIFLELIIAVIQLVQMYAMKKGLHGKPILIEAGN
ncbi:hypothetical protein JTE88_02375 [Arcanobacterium phocisimile]|uniref:Uncharacterized protein n=1 Tax=Arcanobacterium phocisimile TaxID=1302235 RepID=A0ABX7II23_9ACTO|nr:hypothetical protein [Arcanobacterium phocisimile]QRV02612.1 hypothetical protein JTE88_02375 [Arcanobacterium phocisimile]